MPRLLRIGPAISAAAFLLIVGAIAWVLISSVSATKTILEETQEIELTLVMQRAFASEVALTEQLIQNVSSSSPTGESSQPVGSSPDSGSVVLHSNTDEDFDAYSAAFQVAAMELRTMLRTNVGGLDEVVEQHNGFLDSVVGLHIALEDGGPVTEDTMNVYHSVVRVRESEVNAALNALRTSQNVEVPDAVEELGKLETLLRREVPAAAVLAVILVVASLRVTRRRNRIDEIERVHVAKTRFIATVSHELRTPLTGVVGDARLLNDPDLNLSTKERSEMVASIASQSMEVASIVEDLLVAARAELGELRVVAVPMDLKAQATQVLALWALDSPVFSRVVGESVSAVGDPTRVRQVVRNLISNALRYGGPRIEIEVGSRSANGAYIAVCDNGIGVPPRYRELMFNPFERTHEDETVVESVGLGLAVSRELARMMGGDLTYRYEKGRSVFELLLPPAEESTDLLPDTSNQTTFV